MKESFEQMQELMMHFVDLVHNSHAGGVCFGTKYPLHPAEIHTVVAIGEKEGIGVTRLATLLNVSKPTISERIQKLVKKGFVQKIKAPDDQKSVTLWLTPDGNTASVHHELHHQQMYEVFLEHFGDEAREKINLFGETFSQAAQVVKKMNARSYGEGVISSTG